jgi:hypothetical protein
MSWFLSKLRKSAKKDANQKAAEIKAKYEAKRQVQGPFTPAQEELMDELGLTPGKVNESKAKEKTPKNTKARDPLTARQRKLAEELGLSKRK